MTKHESLILQTGSRLHFGLFGGQSSNGLSYGGIGAMVEKPGIELYIAQSNQRSFSGPQKTRLLDFTNRWIQFNKLEPECEFELTLMASPDSHVGLGTGTQVGLATSALLYQFHFGEVPSIEKLAKSVQRGMRSAVGTYGFLHGGFILDQGKPELNHLSQLGLHCPIPDSWRFILIKASNPVGLSGDNENQIFSDSNELMGQHHHALVDLTKNKILPALYDGDFATFAENIYKFGKVSGSYFSHIQGGSFNGPRITQIVEFARKQGIQGTGQSSWGPTVYLLAESENQANQVVATLSEFLLPDETIIVSAPQKNGYQITAESGASL